MAPDSGRKERCRHQVLYDRGVREEAELYQARDIPLGHTATVRVASALVVLWLCGVALEVVVPHPGDGIGDVRLQVLREPSLFCGLCHIIAGAIIYYGGWVKIDGIWVSATCKRKRYQVED